MADLVVCSACMHRQQRPASGLCSRCNSDRLQPDEAPASGGLELPPEPDALTLPVMPVPLAEPRGLELPPAKPSSAAPASPTVVARADAPVTTPVVQISAPRPPSFQAGLLSALAGVVAFVSWLRDPLDGFGQWAALIGIAAGAFAGLAVAAEFVTHRLFLVVTPVLAAGLGLARGDPFMTLASGAFAIGAWFACDEQDDRRPTLGLATMTAALLALCVAIAPAWVDQPSWASTVARLRRTGGPLVTAPLSIGPHFTFTAAGWALRRSDETQVELAQPPIGGRAIMRVQTLRGDIPQSAEGLIALARADFERRGWVDFALGDQTELVDGADETVLAGFRVRRGFSRDLGLIWASRMKNQVCTMAALVPSSRGGAGISELRTMALTAKCREGTAGVVELAPAVVDSLQQGLVTVRRGDTVGVAVVIERREGQLVLAGDDAVLGAEASVWANVRPMLEPTGALRRARVLRRSDGVMLLLMSDDPALKPIDFAPLPAVDTPIAAVGIDATAVIGRASVRSGRLSVADAKATFEAGFRLASALLVTPKGEVVGMLRGGTGSTRDVLVRGDVRPLTTPGVRELSWHVEVSDTGTCALTARVDIDDPFHELDVVSLVFGERRHEMVSAVQKSPGPGTLTLHTTLTCPPSETGWSIGVECLSLGSMSKLLDTIEPVTSLPASLRGHTLDPSRPTVVDAEYLGWLFDRRAPEPLACGGENQSPCSVLCDRNNADACMLSGQALLEAGRSLLAVNDFERGCVGHHLEACMQLAFLSAKHKTLYDTRPLLQPWCTAGVRRACWALKPKAWEDAVRAERKQCATEPAACLRESLLLLDGPRGKSDLDRAGAQLLERCSESDAEACLALGLERRRRGALSDSVKYLDRACFRKNVDACVEVAGAYASGSGTSRNMEQAVTLLRSACGRGHPRACSLTPKLP